MMDGGAESVEPDDWGGDGKSGMRLSKRCTLRSPTDHVARQYQVRPSHPLTGLYHSLAPSLAALIPSAECVPHAYVLQFFDTQAVKAEPWFGPAPLKSGEALGEAFPLSWKTDANSARAECTLRVALLVDSAISSAQGYFTTDVEIFVLSGALKVGDWLLKKHSYTFIPAGVSVGAVVALAKAHGHSRVEIIWMENGPSAARHVASAENTPVGAVRLSELVVPLDPFYIPWTRTDTSQFASGGKKWLRRAPNGGGCWLLNVLPHFDGRAAMIQNCNAEVVCISGSFDVGDTRLRPGFAGYVPSGTIAPYQTGVEGSMFFVRVDRDLSERGAVVAIDEMPLPDVDWGSADATGLPGPSVGIIPPGFLKHIGMWEGSYTHIGPDGQVLDRHECRIEIGMHGSFHSQRNTYTWRNDDGVVTKTEILDFPGMFDRDGVLWIENERISGRAMALDVDGTVVFYAGYKMAGGVGPAPDCYDVLRIFNEEETLRYRTWQVKSGEKLLKLVHVEETRISDANSYWIPRRGERQSFVDKLEASRPVDHML